MQKNPSIRQTHFIGVLLPDELTRMLEECRRYMNRLYGCMSGHATPVHITLVPPFALPREYTTADVVETLLHGIPKVELDTRLSGNRAQNNGACRERRLEKWPNYTNPAAGGNC